MFRFPGRSSEGASTSASAKRSQKKGQNEASAGAEGGRTPQSKKKGKFAGLPEKLRRTRACMICSLIKTEFEFEEEGCDNCESFLQLARTKGAVVSYTSANFEGMIGMINPKESWVAKWQRICTLKPGAYAVNVRGEVEKWVKGEMADAGIPYYCRDKTVQFGPKADDDKPKKRRRNRRISVEVEDVNENETAVASGSGAEELRNEEVGDVNVEDNNDNESVIVE